MLYSKYIYFFFYSIDNDIALKRILPSNLYEVRTMLFPHLSPIDILF